MTLRRATNEAGQPYLPAGTGVIPADELLAVHGARFQLPCDDSWLEKSDTGGRAYLDGAAAAWIDNPDYMDILDEDSPVWDLKRAERDLYLHHWRGWRDAKRVLDVGCGVGRFTTRLLDEGATVYGVDGDHESLVRCAWHAAGRPGALDLHWSTPWTLPDVSVDAAVACEVLCYLPDPSDGLRAIRERLTPNGTLYLGMEARYGWAAAQDAPTGAADLALTSGGHALLDVPGDRLVHLYDREALAELLDRAGFEPTSIVATHYFTDGPLEDTLPDDLSLEQLLALESRAREHRVWGPLNRIWAATARKR